MRTCQRRHEAPPGVTGRGLPMSGGLAVDPGEQVAFFPAQVLADAVGGQAPGAPFVADGAFRHAQYCGYLSCGQQAVGPAEGAFMRWLCSPPPGGHLLCPVIAGWRMRRASPPFPLANVSAVSFLLSGSWQPTAAGWWRLRSVVVHVHVHGACVALCARAHASLWTR